MDAPTIGAWFYEKTSGGMFEVISIARESIQIRYFDLSVDDMSVVDWQADMASGEIEQAAPPDEYTGEWDE